MFKHIPVQNKQDTRTLDFIKRIGISYNAPMNLWTNHAREIKKSPTMQYFLNASHSRKKTETLSKENEASGGKHRQERDKLSSQRQQQ